MRIARNRASGGARRGRVVAWVIGCLVVGCVGLFAEAPSGGILPSESAWTVVRPSVLWCGERDAGATIEVHIVGRSDVVAARVVGPNETFLLYDDGTHGDAVAGDLIFTAGGAVPYCHTGLSLKYERTVGLWLGTLEVTLADGSTLVDLRPVRIGLAQPRYRGKTAVVDYQNGLSATAYAFFIQDIDNVIFDGYPVANADEATASQKVLRLLYSVLPDAFDLVILIPGRTLVAPGSLAERSSQCLRAANDVEHIGIPVFNDAALYGSAGRLRGVIVQPFGSIDFLDSDMAGLWGADIGVPVGLAESVGQGRFFWSPYCDVGGQLASYVDAGNGSFGRLVPNGDGTWRLSSPSENERYSPLELYAMGFVPADDVPPVHLLSGLDASDPNRITATSVQTVTMDDVVASQGGTRSPSPEASPRSFTVAVVVVQEDLFTDAEYAYYSLLSYHLMTQDPPERFDQFAPFFWATGGRGTLDCRLPIDVKPIEVP